MQPDILALVGKTFMVKRVSIPDIGDDGRYVVELHECDVPHDHVVQLEIRHPRVITATHEWAGPPYR